MYYSLTRNRRNRKTLAHFAPKQMSMVLLCISRHASSAGQALISRTVKDLVAGSGIMFDDAGEHSLKGIEEKWRIYKVRDIA